MNRIQLAFVAFAMVILSANVLAGPCDAHFTFDGYLSDSSGNGNDGEMISKGGESAEPNYVDGKFGQALRFDGETAMRAFVDLHYDACPQVTISAWIKVEQSSPGSAQRILSTGSGSGPGIGLAKKNLTLNGPANGLLQLNVVRPGSDWMFVAGVYDYPNDTYTLHWRNRSGKPKKLGLKRRDPEEALWVGAFNDGLTSAASGVLVDEVRVYGRILEAEELVALRSGSAPGAESQHAGSSDLPSTVAATAGSTLGNGISVGDIDYNSPTDILPSGDGMTVEELQEQLAEQNAGLIGDVDYQSPTDILDGAESSSGESGSTGGQQGGSGQGETTTQQQALAVAKIAVPVGDGTTSGLSGFTGTNRERLDLKWKFLGQILWREKNDRPCDVELVTIHSNLDPIRLLICDGTGIFGGNERSRRAVYTWTGTRPNKLPIRGIRVCNNDNNKHRLKGIQILHGGIDDSGERIDLPDTDSDKHANCDVWDNSANCPSESLATGLLVHSNESGGGKQEIVGLELICRRIEMR